MALPGRRPAAIALAGIALFLLAAAALLLARGRDSGFQERSVDPTTMPRLARDEIRAHGGGRCVEQRPTVFFCTLAAAKQAHEGPSGREWCFDSDGPQVLSMYPARRDDGEWTCGGA